MKDNETLESNETQRADLQSDLLHKEITEQRKPEKLTFKSILNYLYSSAGRTAITFSLGVLVGILVITVFFSSTVNNTSSVSGTVGGLENYENFEAADYLQISNAAAYGNISIQYRNEMVIAQVNLDSDDNVKMMLSFNPDNMKVYSVKPLQVNDESSVNSGRSFITLNNKGQSKYLILFRDNNNQEIIQVKLISGGGQVDNYTVKTRPN